jgi:phosphonopyruvate decarboxylase
MMTQKLDRRDVLKALIPNPSSYLFVTGLAGAAKDTAALTKDGNNLFTMAGTMGAAVSMGLGVAISAPQKQTIVITGDGEILMNLGSLATVATMKPKNLSIICIDNGCHGETGGQKGHTNNYTNLEGIAIGAGIKSTITIETIQQLSEGRTLLKSPTKPSFIVIKVSDGPPSKYKRNLDPAECRLRFRSHFLKH